MSSRFEAINLIVASLPIYRNESNGAVLGYVTQGTQRFIFASSFYQAQQGQCGLFSYCNYFDGEIHLNDDLTTTGRYNDLADAFQFESDVHNHINRSAGGILQGNFKRIGTCLCEIKDGELHVSQIFSN